MFQIDQTKNQKRGLGLLIGLVSLKFLGVEEPWPVAERWAHGVGNQIHSY